MSANLTSKKTVKLLLKEYGVRPGRQMGQNFLVDHKALKKFIQAVDIQPKDVILEVGPGLGVITQELVKIAKRVIAVEKDPKLAEILGENLKGFNNVEVINSDILKILNTLYKILNTPYKVAANLPFNVASPVIRQFLEAKKPPTEMVFFVQKEVGQRICAVAPKASFLSIFVQSYAKAQIVSYVSKKSFWPEPKVDAAIIKITIGKKQLTINRGVFLKIIRAGFSQPRKQVLNNLAKVLKLNKEKTRVWLLENGVRPEQRAETLTLENWEKLAKSFKAF